MPLLPLNNKKKGKLISRILFKQPFILATYPAARTSSPQTLLYMVLHPDGVYLLHPVARVNGGLLHRLFTFTLQNYKEVYFL